MIRSSRRIRHAISSGRYVRKSSTMAAVSPSFDPSSLPLLSPQQQQQQQQQQQPPPTRHDFPATFTPLHVSPHIAPLSNRVMMGSMHCGLEPHSIPSFLLSSSGGQDHGPEALAEYYAERARGMVALIVTGGIAPNRRGWVGPFAAKLTTPDEVARHRVVTDAVHGENGGHTKICMQILHAGRYAMHPFLVAPSRLRAPINPFTPFALSTRQVRNTIRDYVNCAVLAREAGYDGVEIMGSEGYLLHQFLSRHTNRRTDEYGGHDFHDRMRFALEIVRQTKQAVGDDFLLVYRLSLLDLMDDYDCDWEEVKLLAQALEDAGVHIINTGIGWHEARIPTIATCVPRAAFVPSTTMKLRRSNVVKIPLVASNRINDPDVIENLLSGDQHDSPDLVSMARPFLADPHIVRKMYEAHVHAHDTPAPPPLLNVNTCIGCNQACLDHIFEGRVASCTVNPEAGHELEFKRLREQRDRPSQRIAVVGAGPAGMACAVTAAELGHDVTLLDQQAEVGGQFHMAKLIPGKEEFYETLRYFRTKLHALDNIELRMNETVEAKDLLQGGYDRVVVATGVLPRTPPIPGVDHPKVLTYVDVLRNRAKVGKRVAIIGAGGIGFDVAEFLLHDDGDDDDGQQHQQHSPHGSQNHDNVTPANGVSVSDFFDYWGIDPTNTHRGGLLKNPTSSSSVDGTTAAATNGSNNNNASSSSHQSSKNTRQITVMQRKQGKLGKNLGKTTGWIHRAQLKKGNVTMVGGCRYEKIDEHGNLHLEISTRKKGSSDDDVAIEQRILEVDNIILCAGQNSLYDLETELQDALLQERREHQQHQRTPPTIFRIGGAYQAGELDAKRAIDMGVRLAYDIDLKDAKVTDEDTREKGDEEKLMLMVKKLMGR